MMTARFVSGATLFALLVVDICCFPAKKGSNPGASYGGGPAAYQPVAGGQPAASFGSSSSGYWPIVSGYGGSSAASTQPGAALLPASLDSDWAVAPSMFSAGEGMSAGTRGLGLGVPEYGILPAPEYQGGELTSSELTVEKGDYQRETEEQGSLPAPPPFMPGSAGQGLAGLPQPSAGQGLAGLPQPVSSMGGRRGAYPYYDYLFLTGRYPPGTVGHSSSSQEQGSDQWQDVHYQKYSVAPVRRTEILAVPQRQPVQQKAAGYRV